MKTTTETTLRADLLALAAEKIAESLDDDERSENELIRDYVTVESDAGLLAAVRHETYDLQAAWYKLYTQRRALPAKLAALKK